MPPKKKKGKGKKKKKDDSGELSIDEKYKKTLSEIETLKEHLAMRTEIARRSQAKSEQMRDKMLEAQDTIFSEQRNKLEISADLTRQYKTMQTEMTLRIHTLEKQLAILQEKLGGREEELRLLKEEKAQIVKEKDAIIENLEFKLDHMETAYENILHDALDAMANKIEKAKSKWEEESTNIQQKNKDLLLEFGLNPLDI